jgi:hypothetical protein
MMAALLLLAACCLKLLLLPAAAADPASFGKKGALAGCGGRCSSSPP